FSCHVKDQIASQCPNLSCSRTLRY
ncbi:hypothetical protein TIFTF001_012875, partial [Ficus carica]